MKTSKRNKQHKMFWKARTKAYKKNKKQTTTKEIEE